MKDGKALPPDKPALGIVLTGEIKNHYSFVRSRGCSFDRDSPPVVRKPVLY